MIGAFGGGEVIGPPTSTSSVLWPRALAILFSAFFGVLLMPNSLEIRLAIGSHLGIKTIIIANMPEIVISEYL